MKGRLTPTQWKKAKQDIYDTFWGRLNGMPQRREKMPGVNWNQYYKKELKLLSRDEARMLLGMRSGHNHMNHYMHRRLKLDEFPTSLCYCGKEEQTFEHIIKECRDEETRTQVRNMQSTVAEDYSDAWYKWVQDESKDMPYWTIDDLDFNAVRTYAFPIRGITDGIRGRILRQGTKLFRWVIKKSQRWRKRARALLQGTQDRHRDAPFERG